MPDKGDPLLWQLTLQFILILVNAIFACAEIALITVSDTKLEKLSAAGDKRAKRLLSLTKEPAKFLATIQVGITLAGFLGSAFAAGNFSGKLTAWLIDQGVKIPRATIAAVSVVIITLILSFFTLVLGELVPKRLAMKKADSLAFAMSGLIVFISKIFAPVVWLLTKSTNGLLRLLGIDPNADDETVTEEEIRFMVDLGSARGTINAREKEIIHNVFEFDNKSAGEAMTHRRDVIFLDLSDDDAAWEKTILEKHHSYYPIFDQGPDSVVGILNARDYLGLSDRRREAVMKNAVREAAFIPQSIRTDVLFRNMKKTRIHFAVLLDEYGGMSGIITMNDLLEQLVGDLDDDLTMPPEDPPIVKTGPGSWRISGGADLDKAAAEIGLPLPLDEHDTFGGLVFSLLGHIPEDGEQPEFEALGLKIKLLEIRDHRLEKALVQVVLPNGEIPPKSDKNP
ncbi:hemolysin [Spirochaetia bacterium]|nr:hemolysin [Spirochaetia bacterium]